MKWINIVNKTLNYYFIVKNLTCTSWIIHIVLFFPVIIETT